MPHVTKVEVTSTPASGNTYHMGETIVFRAHFSQPVVVTGSPKLVLTIGRAARYRCSGCSDRRSWMEFEYTVQRSDATSKGIGIETPAPVLNGGTIKAAVGAADADPLVQDTSYSGHKVDGSQETPPKVSRVTFKSAPSGGTYQAGQRIAIRVDFDRSVVVAGKPSLALTIGDQVRQARYCAVCMAGNASAVFEYVVQTTDADADGIGIRSLTLAEGSAITLLGSNTTTANVALGQHAIARAAKHRVKGRPEAAGRPNATSIPSADDSRITCDKTDKRETALAYCDLRLVVAAFQRERILKPKLDTLNRRLKCPASPSSQDSVNVLNGLHVQEALNRLSLGRQVNIPCGANTDSIHRLIVVDDFLIEAHQKYKELKENAEIRVQEDQIAEIGDDLEELLRKNDLFKRMNAHVRVGPSFSDASRNGDVDNQDGGITKAMYDIAWRTKSYRDFVFSGGMGLAPVFAVWSFADADPCTCRHDSTSLSNMFVHSTRGFYYDVTVKKYWKDYRIGSFLSVGQERILDTTIRPKKRAMVMQKSSDDTESEQDAVLADNGVGLWSTKIDLGMTLQFFDVDDRDLIDYVATEPMLDMGFGVRYNGRWKPDRALAELRVPNSGAFADTRARLYWRASVDLVAVSDFRNDEKKKPFSLLVVAEQEFDWPAGTRKMPSTTKVLVIGEFLVAMGTIAQ